MFGTSNICFKVKAKARPPASPPPLRLLAERYGVPTPPTAVAPTATPEFNAGKGMRKPAESSSSSSWNRVREPSGDEEIVYTPPHGRYDDEVDMYHDEVVEVFDDETDVRDEGDGDDQFEYVEEEVGEGDMVVDGPVGFEVVEEPAPWAGVAHKGTGKASKGARIHVDDDGGQINVGLNTCV